VAALREHRLGCAAARLKLCLVWRENDLVFPNEIGGALRHINVRYHSYVPTVKRAGVPYIRPHDLRHPAATLALLDTSR